MTLSLSSILSNEQDILSFPTIEVQSFIETLDKHSLQHLLDHFSAKISSDKGNLFYSFFYFYRGFCYQLLELSDDSLSDYNKAIKLNSTNDRYYYYRAELSFFKFNDPISALYDCSKAIEFRHNINIDYFLLRASILLELGINSLKGVNHDGNHNTILYRALEDLDFVITVYPDNVKAYTLRLSCFYNQKKYDKCISDCESALKLLDIKADWFAHQNLGNHIDTTVEYYLHTLYWYWNALTEINDLPKANLFKYLYIDTLANQQIFYANQFLYDKRFEESLRCLELALDYLKDCNDLYSSGPIEITDKLNSLLKVFESKKQNLLIQKEEISVD